MHKRAPVGDMIDPSSGNVGAYGGVLINARPVFIFSEEAPTEIFVDSPVCADHTCNAFNRRDTLEFDSRYDIWERSGLEEQRILTIALPFEAAQPARKFDPYRSTFGWRGTLQ